MRTGLGVIVFAAVAVAIIAALSAYYDVKSDITLACITAVITVAGWLYTSRSAASEASHTRLHAAKAEIYERLFDLIARQMRTTAFEQKQPTEDELMALAKEFHEIKSKLLIWGSDTTLKSWLEIEKIEIDTTKMIQAWGKLFYSMRHDLGHYDRSVSDRDLAVFFVKSSDKDKIA